MSIYHQNDECRVLIDPDSCHLLVEKLLGTEWVTTLDYAAPNLVMLSEHFRDAVGYAFAVEALTIANVDRNAPLWTLGNKGGDTHWTI